MMRSAPIVLGCLLAFIAVAFAESEVQQDSTCVTYYKNDDFYMNCSILDGTYKEVNLSFAQWSGQV